MPGLLVTAAGVGLALPTAAIVITSGVQGRDQGMAGALFTSGQQIGAAIGLAVLATGATARTEHATGSLASGYRLAYLIAAGFAALAAVLVVLQLSSRDCQQELARQQRLCQPPPRRIAPKAAARAQPRGRVPDGSAAEAELRSRVPPITAAEAQLRKC